LVGVDTLIGAVHLIEQTVPLAFSQTLSTKYILLDIEAHAFELSVLSVTDTQRNICIHPKTATT